MNQRKSFRRISWCGRNMLGVRRQVIVCTLDAIEFFRDKVCNSSYLLRRFCYALLNGCLFKDNNPCLSLLPEFSSVLYQSDTVSYQKRGGLACPLGVRLTRSGRPESVRESAIVTANRDQSFRNVSGSRGHLVKEEKHEHQPRSCGIFWL